jgi:membrane protein
MFDTRLGRVLKNTGSQFVADDCMGNGAAIAYYTIFSLPPLLAMVFALATQFWPEDTVTQVIKSQLGLPIAEADTDGESESAESGSNLTTVAERATATERQAWWAKILGACILAFSATGVLAQLQLALNKAWNVEPDPDRGGLKAFLMKRALSLGMVVVIGLLLLVSLVITTMVDEFTRWIQGGILEGPVLTMMVAVNFLLNWGLATLLFAATFQILPDAKIAWRDVWVGAAVTGLLFVLGKTAIGWYLQFSHAGSSWGSAASSMVGVLVWVYYSSLIILIGAEFTQNWSIEFGRGFKPTENAVLVTEHKEHHRSQNEVLEADGRSLKHSPSG